MTTDAEALDALPAKAKRDWFRNPPACPYCHAPAVLVTGDVIYADFVSAEVAHALFWQCAPCDAYVGTHRNSKRAAPFGTLANKELRTMRRRVHSLLDPLWRSGEMARPEAYAWLATRLGLDVKRTHVGMFREPECMAAILCLEQRAGDRRVAEQRARRGQSA